MTDVKNEPISMGPSTTDKLEKQMVAVDRLLRVFYGATTDSDDGFEEGLVLRDEEGKIMAVTLFVRIFEDLRAAQLELQIEMLRGGR